MTRDRKFELAQRGVSRRGHRDGRGVGLAAAILSDYHNTDDVVAIVKFVCTQNPDLRVVVALDELDGDLGSAGRNGELEVWLRGILAVDGQSRER